VRCRQRQTLAEFGIDVKPEPVSVGGVRKIILLWLLALACSLAWWSHVEVQRAEREARNNPTGFLNGALDDVMRKLKTNDQANP
jgi:hypothetical protein